MMIVPFVIDSGPDALSLRAAPLRYRGFSENITNSPLFIALLTLSVCLSIPWNAWRPIFTGRALKELLAGLRTVDWKEFLVIIGCVVALGAVGGGLAYLMSDIVIYMLYILIAMCIIMFLGSMVQPLAHARRRRVDSLRLKLMVLEPDYDWPQVYHIARNFRTDGGQAQFFETLLARRATIHDTGTGPADFQPLGPQAAEQWALLREQVYGLRE